MPEDSTLDAYRFQMEHFPILCVDIVFFDPTRSKTLLLRRVNKPMQGIYYTVGGHVIKNEDLKAAALRVAKAETGIVLDESKLVFGGVISEKHPDSIFEGVSYNGVTVYYGYIIDERELVVFNSENDDQKWFEVTDDAIHPYIRERLQNLQAAFTNK